MLAVEVGSIAEIVSGVGAVVAAGIALWIAVGDRRAREKEDRTRRLAVVNRISIACGTKYRETTGTRWIYYLRNHSGEPLFNVRGGIRIASGVLDFPPVAVMQPQDEPHHLDVVTPDDDGTNPPVDHLCFEDYRGEAWKWNPDGRIVRKG